MSVKKNVVLGRRTGRDIKAGKVIRVLDDGFENFSDYWTDSGAEESSLSWLKEDGSTNTKSLVTRQKDGKPLQSMSPFTPSDHEITKSMLKQLAKKTRKTPRKSTPNKDKLGTEACDSAGSAEHDRTLKDRSTDELEVTAERTVNDRRKESAGTDSDKSMMPPDSVMNSSHKRGIVRSPLLVEGNAVGSFSKNGSEELKFPPKIQNSALLSFKTKKRLTYSGDRCSDEHQPSSETHSLNEREELTADKQEMVDIVQFKSPIKNKARKSSSQKDRATKEARDSNKTETDAQLVASELLTSERPTTQLIHNLEIESDSENSHFVALQNRSPVKRSEQQLHQGGKDKKYSSPLNKAKPLGKTEKKKRSYVSEDEFGGTNQEIEKEWLMDTQITKDRNNRQNKGKKGKLRPKAKEVKNGGLKARRRTTSTLKSIPTEEKQHHKARKSSAEFNANPDRRHPLHFNFDDSDEDSNLSSGDQNGLRDNSLQRKTTKKKQSMRRRAVGLKSNSGVASLSHVPKKGRCAKQDRKVASPTNINVQADETYTTQDNDGLEITSPKKLRMEDDLKENEVDGTSDKSHTEYKHDDNGVQTSKAKAGLTRKFERGHADLSDLETCSAAGNKKGQRSRHNLKSGDDSKSLPEGNKDHSSLEMMALKNVNTQDENQPPLVGSSVVVQDEPQAETAISPHPVLPVEEQGADVYSFHVEDKEKSLNVQHNRRSAKKKSRKMKASVFHEQTTSPNLSPIGPASHRFIDDSVLSDYSGNPNGNNEDLPLENHQVAILKRSNRRRSTMPNSKRKSTGVKRAGMLKSILKTNSTLVTSPSSAVHYCEVTASKTPTLQITGKKKTENKVKIIVPEPCPEGLRRSQRTRVLPLDWFRNERIKYARRKSGLVVAGIESPKYDDNLKPITRKEKLQQLVRRRQKVKSKLPKTPRNLSIHVPVENNWQTTMAGEIPVLDPTTQEEVLIDCVVTKKQHNFCNVYGEAAGPGDPLILSKAMIQPAFSLGQLVLRPLEEKCTQYVRNDSMIFVIKKGKVAVTIHNTTSILETDDSFFIPQGNTYSIKNLRKDEAKFWFFQHRG